MRLIGAIFLLGWSLLQSFFAHRLSTKAGIVAFREKFAADRLPNVTKEERDFLTQASGCIACGLCNVGEGVAIARSKGEYAGPMDLALASSRNMPDYDAAIASIAHVSEDRLRIIEAICPGRVPLVELTRFIRRKAEDARKMGESATAT